MSLDIADNHNKYAYEMRVGSDCVAFSLVIALRYAGHGQNEAQIAYVL